MEWLTSATATGCYLPLLALGRAAVTQSTTSPLKLSKSCQQWMVFVERLHLSLSPPEPLGVFLFHHSPPCADINADPSRFPLSFAVTLNLLPPAVSLSPSVSVTALVPLPLFLAQNYTGEEQTGERPPIPFPLFSSS